MADRFTLRLLGLMRLGAEEIVPIVFPRCRLVHMHGMKTPIDLVWLVVEGDQASVAGVVESLQPGRHASAPRAGAARAVATLELSPGEAPGLGLRPGATVSLR